MVVEEKYARATCGSFSKTSLCFRRLALAFVDTPALAASHVVMRREIRRKSLSAVAWAENCAFSALLAASTFLNPGLFLQNI